VGDASDSRGESSHEGPVKGERKKDWKKRAEKEKTGVINSGIGRQVSLCKKRDSTGRDEKRKCSGKWGTQEKRSKAG